MARWIEGEVIANHHWTDTHHSLRVRAPAVPFQAGQFSRLAQAIDGHITARPYSFVNPPQDEVLEFYSTVVPEGPFSSRLHALAPGDPILVAPRGAGCFTLDRVPDAPSLWLLATGTALGPFLSILRTDEPWQRFRRIVLVHAARHCAELAYRELIESLPPALTYLPVVSREPCPEALAGRIPALIASGELEQAAGASLTPNQAQVMICGNPDMVQDTARVLGERGLQPNNRKQTGHVTTEQYW